MCFNQKESDLSCGSLAIELCVVPGEVAECGIAATNLFHHLSLDCFNQKISDISCGAPAVSVSRSV